MVLKNQCFWNKKQNIVFTSYKTCIFIAKTVKNTLNVHVQKKLFLISDKKAKSKCTKCLTGKTFFDKKKNDKYDVEQLVKHFFLYWCIL